MDIFAIGEVVVGSEKNITEKYATKLLYRQLMTPTTFDANSSVIAVLCSMMAFLVLCVVVLVARHHGREIVRTMDPTLSRAQSAKRRRSGFLTPPPGSDPYERRVRKKVKAGW